MANKNYMFDEDDDFVSENTSNNNDELVTSDGTDIYSDEIPDEDVSPLKGQTIKRDYANYTDPNSIDPNLVPDLEEMEINPNDPADILNDDDDENFGDEISGGNKKGNQNTIGDDLNLGDTNTLSDREQTLLAENTADTIFDAWDKLHDLGKWIAKISDDKLISYHREGRINLQDEVSDENGNPITIGEVFQGLNRNIDQVLNVDDDFRDKYRPALIREIKRRKLYMTDATYLAIGFGKSFVELGVASVSLKINMNKQLKMFEAMHTENLEQMKRANDLKEEELRLQREVVVNTKNKTKVNTDLSSVTAEVVEEDADFTTENSK